MIPACGPVDHLDFGSDALSDLKFAKRKKKSLPENMLTTTISRTFWRNTTIKSKKFVVYRKMPYQKKNREKVEILKKQLIYGPTLIRSCGDF